MLFKTAIRIILHEKAKFLGAVVAVAVAGFLVLFQWAVYLGYEHDTTVVLDAFDADIWIMPKGQPSFDGFVPMDDLPYWRAKELPEIEKAARVVWGYATWRLLEKNSLDCVQVLGVEFDAGIGLNVRTESDDLASLLRPDGYVLVGRKSQEKLEVPQAYIDGAEISGRQVVVAGFVEDIHLFTTYGFVLTDLDNGRAFLDSPPSHVTYVACKCRPGTDVRAVARQLQQRVPEHDVLTTADFRQLTARFWKSKTGVGPLLIFPSVLAGLVGFLMVTLTFYISTVQKLPVYASIKAIGAASGELIVILGLQVLMVSLLGCAVAGLCLWPVVAALRTTTISVVVSPALVFATMGALLFCSAVGALLSIQRVIATEPGRAFRT
jgi:putative ABC transport system permease protein